MIDSKVLLKALQKQVTALEKDLTPTGLADARLKVEWRAARNADRTAATFETWLGERVTQVAVAWVLGTVFLRFCEDNCLIEYPFITGPGERADLARDLQAEYFQKHPEQTDRDWIIAGFDDMSVSPVAKGLFDRRHNPMWVIRPSHDAAKELLAFWRETGSDGQVIYDLTDPAWDTRFLGDLYQDLSEAARKTYALLQTPEFIEEFILKYTLDPALEEFGLEPTPPQGHENLPNRLRVIDPACGSGHFLLGAFSKLLAAWEGQRPSADKWELIREALSSIHGVDKNPFAVAIARFRLMLAAMRAGGIEGLSEQVDFPLNIACGDSLMHGKDAPGTQMAFSFDGGQTTHTYRTEDVDELIKSVHILEPDTYHVVVGNPPYITPKDKAENEKYRNAYKRSCSGKYALSIPFAQRIFELAIPETGYTGQITSNSFMKREFGRKLIEDYFNQVDLSHVIDTSVAYIPGHGTPTVILIGHRRYGGFSRVTRAVLGIRGEPNQPDDPAHGLVWKAIQNQIDEPGSESEWVSSADVPREFFLKFPWTLSGGGADELTSSIAKATGVLQRLLNRAIGFASFPGQDEAFFLGSPWLRRHDVRAPLARVLVVGETVRDWGLTDNDEVLVPFDAEQHPVPFNIATPWGRHLWMFRRVLSSTTGFGGQTREDVDDPWWTWYRWVAERYATPLSITFAEVATHNHFVLDRGGKVFKQTAPVIKLPEGSTEDEHLGLLGVLNSSTICFWLQQVCHNKGGPGGGSSKDEKWHDFYQHNGANVERCPLPSTMPSEFGRVLDSLARQLASLEPFAVCSGDLPTRARLDAAREEHGEIRGQMIALQEELDWDVYRRYGLISDDEATGLIPESGIVPEIKLGEHGIAKVI